MLSAVVAVIHKSDAACF